MVLKIRITITSPDHIPGKGNEFNPISDIRYQVIVFKGSDLPSTTKIFFNH